MNKSINLFATACILSANFAYAEEQYLCTVDRVAGFKYDRVSNQWEQTSFKANSKYLLTETDKKTPSEDLPYLLRKVGQEMPIGICEKSFDESGYLSCKSLDGEFQFNRKLNRFIIANTFGFVTASPNSSDESSEQPSIEIGKCFPL